MKSLSTLALILSLFLISCASDEQFSASSEDLFSSTPASSTDGQDCFDLQLQTWYNAFQHYQSAGYDMQSADQKALTEAAEAYKTCAAR